jgi:hypothetical protein
MNLRPNKEVISCWSKTCESIKGQEVNFISKASEGLKKDKNGAGQSGWESGWKSP